MSFTSVRCHGNNTPRRQPEESATSRDTDQGSSMHQCTHRTDHQRLFVVFRKHWKVHWSYTVLHNNSNTTSHINQPHHYPLLYSPHRDRGRRTLSFELTSAPASINSIASDRSLDHLPLDTAAWRAVAPTYSYRYQGQTRDPQLFLSTVWC